MSNYHVEPASKPQALTKEALKSLRNEAPKGLSRRQLLRTSLGAAVGLWLLEVGAGTISFLWPNLSGGFGGEVDDRHVRRHQEHERRPPDRRGLPGLLPGGPGLRHARRPVAPGVHPRRGPDRRRHRAQRAGALPALPAPRLQAQPVPASPSGSSAPATARATTGSARRSRSSARRPRGHGPLRRDRARPTGRSSSTRARSPSGRSPWRSASPASSRRRARPGASDAGRRPRHARGPR